MVTLRYDDVFLSWRIHNIITTLQNIQYDKVYAKLDLTQILV